MTAPETSINEDKATDIEDISIVELRRCRRHPGARETLIALFDCAFIETQEAAGMRVVGQPRDFDDADSFVWLRGFGDMPSRKQAPERFYTGPVWTAHGTEANGPMVNSDNVLLLRPAFPGGGFALPATPRPEPGAHETQPSLIVATIAYLAPRTDGAFAAVFEETLRPLLTATSADVLAVFVIERSSNTFPRLPVREGETAFVWFNGFPNLPAHDSHLAALTRNQAWARQALREMARRTLRANDVGRLTATGGSLLHG